MTSQSPIEPPRKIFWTLGWSSFLVGILLFACGYYLASNEIAHIMGMIMVTLGGIGFGIGGRVLISCWLGLRKSKR